MRRVMFSALVWAFCRWWIGLRDLAVGRLQITRGEACGVQLLVGGLVVWLLTYAFEAVNQKMTYHQRDYEEAFLKNG